MRNKKDRKKRHSLVLWMAALLFVVQIVALALAVGGVALLIRTGLLEKTMDLTLTNVMLFIALISLIAGAILSFVTSQIYMKPITRLMNQINRLAEGDFKARVKFGRPIAEHPAIQELERSFNTAAAELEQTEMLRGDFINNFSHEFKTPIVSIAGFAKLLRRGNLTREQQAEYLQIIEEESLRLSHMATSVLSLTRIENQAILTDVSRFNLSEQLRSAILLLEDQWARKKLEFNLQLGEYSIRANEELLRHVWINLLDNAIKFSEEYGCIGVTVTQEGELLQVAIANTGRPIPGENLDRIFRKFYQADESHCSQGSGVGLAVVKKAVELHRGTVAVESGPEVTTFTVTLPKNEA